jgi:hypothetical protein
MITPITVPMPDVMEKVCASDRHFFTVITEGRCDKCGTANLFNVK